ncbi:monovalent cation/H(+) antiporter subunit G [Thaumasiovibrio subtropicus]|uniref:monovalent cation/H(+) antiporter subunit G n=1 Tax=Thaumasiovibrio subtropicus TaxID=1891207 RepID=UPI000B353D64|nr:monovalent cation/H(+) antiporter subunit G [Thaumasiovibrio subtropicus]
MGEIFAGIFLLLGTFFAVVASLGILRLPDLFIRMHAATKAGTVGLAFLLLPVAIMLQEIAVISKVLGTLFFILITAPVAAHLLGQAMVRKGYKIWRSPSANHANKKP